MLSAAPLLPLAVAFGAGIAAAPFLELPGRWPIGGGAALLALAAAALRTGHERLAGGLLLAAVAALGVLRGADHPPPPDHLAAMRGPGTATIEGRLAGEPIRWAPDRARIVLDVEAVVEGNTRRPATGLVQVGLYGEAPPLGEGQRVSLDARLHPPTAFRNPGGFDYPAHLRREGILLVGSARGDRVRPLTPDAPPWPVRVRRWAVATIASQMPEGSAALLAGLVLGERTQVPRETDEAFRRAGVYHVLAVSGFNVALLASGVFVTLSLAGVPRRATAVVAGGVLIGFALVVGGQPSVLRATIMGICLLAGMLLERESQIMNAVALAALAVLAWRPGDLVEPGFLLSFAATAGIIHLAPALAVWLEGLRCPRWLAQALAVSLGAQWAVTPVMLTHFNQLSLIGVAANLVVVPLSAAATTLGLLALGLSLASELAGALVFDFLWALLLVLRGAVWVAAACPAAMVHLPAPGWVEVVAWYAAAVLVPLLAVRRWTRPLAGGLVAAALALSLWPWVRPGDGHLRVVFLDVGQGDAALVELPAGARMLVDGGPGGPRRLDVGERVVAPFLWNRAVGHLDVVALSHSDPDHSGGLGAVLRRFRVGEFWENGRWGPGSEDTLRALVATAVPRRVLGAGERVWLGGALVTVLNPGHERPEAEISENDSSLVLRVDWQGLAVLFTGDLGWRGEQDLLARGESLRVSVLKVGHHGSRFGTTEAFLGATDPAIAVISVGARNPFRHPTPATLARLHAIGARVYRTDQDGAVIVDTDGATLRVSRWATGVTDVFRLDTGLRPVEPAPAVDPAPAPAG